MTMIFDVLKVLLLLTAVARADSIEALETDFSRLNSAEHRLMIGLTIDGALSLGAGAGMMATGRNDQAWRVAGGVTLSFGVINLMLGVSGVVGTARERREYLARGAEHSTDLTRARRDLFAAAQKKALVFGVNLGLDVGYVMGGATAVLTSRLGADHSERWLAGGTAAMLQGVALGVIDLLGVLAARRVKF
jgi:hypothetical protein